MTVTTSNSAIRTPRPSSLYDVLDLILDKGLVIDAYVRVSLVGIELLTIDARVVVASVDTYLRFAEAANRLDLSAKDGTGLPELIGDLQQGGAQKKTSGALEGVKQSVSGLFGGGDEGEDQDGGQRSRRREPQRARSSSRRSRGDDSGGDRERRSERSSERSGGDSGDGDDQ